MPDGSTIVVTATRGATLPGSRVNYIRLGKLTAASAFTIAALYFVSQQVFTASSLEGTVTSPLITIRSPIDGVVSVNALKLGSHVGEQDSLFMIENRLVDDRLRAELEAKLASSKQEIAVLDIKRVEITALREEIQKRNAAHKTATVARLEYVILETSSQLNAARAQAERSRSESQRINALAANGVAAQTKL
jgi:multidrug efflux pump subunit AcrA (membrane-fusion protein)